MQLRKLLLIMVVVYFFVLAIDFVLTCNLFWQYYDPESMSWIGYYESNPISKALMENGVLPINLLFPFLVVVILFVYGYNRFYYDPMICLEHSKEWIILHPDEWKKYKVFYFDDWKMFFPLYFVCIFFIAGHVGGIVSYL